MSEPLKKIERLEWPVTDHALVPVQNERVTLTALVREKQEMGLNLAEITESLLAEGPRLFMILDEQSLRTMIRERVRATISSDRQDNVWSRGKAGNRDSSTRIGQAGQAYWSATWIEVGEKTTAELDANDLKILIRLYRERAGTLIKQVKWLERVDELRRQHRASKLGDLRAKGIDLPTLDEVAE